MLKLAVFVGILSTAIAQVLSAPLTIVVDWIVGAASLGPALDGKVLAALENWHFHPATRDGVPIPSKQDVVYHFKPRSG